MMTSNDLTRAQREALVAIRDYGEHATPLTGGRAGVIESGEWRVPADRATARPVRYYTLRRQTVLALERRGLVERIQIRQMWPESVGNFSSPGWHTKWHRADILVVLTPGGETVAAGMSTEHESKRP